MSSVPVAYRGSVKDVIGPVKAGSATAAVFEYSDAFSVFDWGRMPDELSGKGEALALLAASLFESLGRAQTWAEFAASSVGLQMTEDCPESFRKDWQVLGEKLARSGLRTHYLGMLGGDLPTSSAAPISPVALNALPAGRSRRLVVQQVHITKPRETQVLGRVVPDYVLTSKVPPFPRLIPLEVVFRFSCPPGSSFIDRSRKHPSYLASLGLGELKPEGPWEFPVLEPFTKLERTDRILPLTEALAISGIAGEQLQEVLLSTAWVAGWLRARCAERGLELADGKLEWGISERGEIFLVDAIGPDELRLLRGGSQVSKEFLRRYYRGTPWYKAVQKAKEDAEAAGEVDWKRRVSVAPPPLTPAVKEAAIQLYRALARDIGGVRMDGAWDTDRLVREIQAIEGGAR